MSLPPWAQRVLAGYAGGVVAASGAPIGALFLGIGDTLYVGAVLTSSHYFLSHLLDARTSRGQRLRESRALRSTLIGLAAASKPC